MKGIHELLMSRMQLIHLISTKEAEYIRLDCENEMPVREQTFAEYLADSIIAEVHSIQDRR